MLSVGKRDVGKGLGFGEEMDGTELEEGEAISYQDDGPTVDPDIALAYLDEKLQSVLGHFQKDFEGGVSAENLGAKFGGYGSFLPTYQRSPICPHPRTPKVQNHALRSPSNLQLEGGFHNIKTAASASLPSHCADISNTRALSSTKSLTTHDHVKLDAGMELSHTEELASRSEIFKKSTMPDQKKFKVRIRVGSDNLPTQTRADLYSGLGLVASPSSSFEDSPESEGWSREPHDAPDESPNSILHIMTSFPLEGSMLLSPLAEDLAYLTGNKKSQRRRPDSNSKSETRKSLDLDNGPGSSWNNGSFSITKKKKSSRINGMSLELKNGRTKDVHDIISKISKETDDEASACEKLISEALKLPLLSTSDCTATDFPQSNDKSSELFRRANKAAISLQSSKVESSDMVVNRDDVWANEESTAEVGSIRNMYEDHTENLIGDAEAQPKKYLIHKSGKNYESPYSELNPYKGARTMNQEILINSISKTDMKVGYEELNVWSATKDHNSSKVKRKLKATPGHKIVAEVVKGKAKDRPSLQSKLEKSINQGSKYGTENSKMHNDVRKSRDTYKDIFGDLNIENEEKETESLDYSSGHGLKDSQVTEIGKITLNNIMMEEASSTRIEKPITSESHAKIGSHAAPLVSYLVADASAPAAPVIIKEHWVGCDKCEKWRLLPVGRLPDSLPDKWLCSMLDWLPGMNRCDIEEEETTRALISFHQASIPESAKNPLGHIGGSTSGEFPSGIQHPSSGFNSVASVAKKRNGSTEMGIAVRSQVLADVGDRTKNLQPAVKSRSLIDVNQSPSITNLDIRHLKKSTDLVVEKTKMLNKDKQKLHEHSSDGGDMRNLKKNKKRRAGQDSPRASKKHKNEDPTDDGWLSEIDHHLPSRNGGPNTRSISPFIAAGKDHSKPTEAIPYKNHIVEEIDYSKTSSKKSKDRVRYSVAGSFEKRKADAKDSSAKKRKAKGSQESRHSESLPTAGPEAEEKKVFLKESSQRDHIKEKKARLSIHMSHSNRESNSDRVNRAIPKDLKLAQDPDNVSFKRNMEYMDPSRRDPAPAHPFMEATSSSSKNSSSGKSKANRQDTKGSPVESVSSSPLRSQSKDIHAFNGRHAFDKDCPPKGFELSGSPKRYSDHEIDGRGGAAVLFKKDNGRMEKASGFSHKVTKFSSVLDFRDLASGVKSKGKSTACNELPDNYTVNDVANNFDQFRREEQVADFGLHEVACNNTHSLLNGSLPYKTGSYLRSKVMMRKSKSGLNKSDASNLFDSSQDRMHSHGDKIMGDRLGEHTAAKPQKLAKKHDVKIRSENGKKGTQVKSGSDDVQDAKNENFPRLSACRQNLVLKQEGNSNTFLPTKTDLLETSLLRGKSVVRSPFIGVISTENCNIRPLDNIGSHKGNEIDNTSVDALGRDDSSKGLKPYRKTENQNGGQPTTSRHPTPIGHNTKDLNAPSPARRDSSNQSAANAVKEAKSLKHVADRVKSSGSNAESIGLYFQAALKFLLGASLLESSTSETRHGDLIQSTQMYSSTAKLCEFCAREFEKAQDMASAALAYKCTEVAYMRVIYSSHSNANRDRHELQTALQMAPPGESPSSSASDVDNLNNAATGDKVLLAKGVSSPQVTGSHVISARNRPGFARLLNFAQDVNFAMEASRKSRATLAAANTHLEQAHSEDGISLIKKAVDYNFQDVEGLLLLVRLGMEAISR